MIAQQILNSEDFKRCEAFHGHVCPGLAIGYRAAKSGMAWLEENRSADEEMAAIVESDACSADAVQVLTGCTFGKGNFIFRDYGKMALTLFSRKTGQGVRITARPDSFPPDENHQSLLQKVITDQATEAEEKQFRALHFQRTCRILEAPEDELLDLTPTQANPPPKARIEPSECCGRCGEKVMRSKLETINGDKVCRGCLAHEVG